MPLTVIGREFQGWAVILVLLWLQVEKVIIAPKELASIVVGAEGELGPNEGIVSTGDVVRDQVDQDLHAVPVNPSHQLLKLFQAPSRIFGKIGGDIKVVLDCIRAAGKTFH